jgi:tight adherence protein B
MIWISLIVFLLVLLIVAGGYFLLGAGRTERSEIRERLSLLELRARARQEFPEIFDNKLLSDVPLLNRLLAQLDLAPRIDRRLRQADLKIRVGTFVLISLILFVSGFAFGQLLHWPFIFAVALGAMFCSIPGIVVNTMRRRRIKRFLSQFPDALAMFGRSLRSMTGAIELVAREMPEPIGVEFQKVFEEQNLGIPLRQAFVGMTERVDALDLRFFITAVMVQRETGGNLAEIIDKISYVIRERFRIQGQLNIFTAQARVTGVILALLPIAVAILMGILAPDYLRPLWSEKTGRMMIAAGVVMQVLGILIIRSIIRIKI